jgi:phosphoglycerol geranylgeranyltransferase
LKYLRGNSLYKAFLDRSHLFAILIDPDKTLPKHIPQHIKNLPSQTTHIFVGGSTVQEDQTEPLVTTIKQHTKLPVFLFPGDASQVTNAADALLFLSLLSGRNPEFLIEQHIKAIPKLKLTNLEIIPTAYLLIDGGVKTAVQRVSNTTPMLQTNIEAIVNTALAAEFSGKKLIYLEAGSGAKYSVNPKIVEAVANTVSIPIIIGGGLRDYNAITEIYNAGATMVVVGTAFENNTFVG